MRVRLRFAKLGKVRWTSHRDLARMWERALRRVQLPVVYTGGFTPRPKVSFGLALPTGHESVAEYLDVELETADLDIVSLPARLSPALPAGIDVTAAAVIDAGTDSLQESVTSCTWELEAVGAEVDEIALLVDRALTADSLVIRRERKGTSVTDDVRPAIVSARVTGPPACIADGYVDHAPGAVVLAELATRTRSLRPAELLAALSLGRSEGLREGHVRRTHQWIERDGARREPLPLGATDAPHAEVRAS
ncbi:MAG TPA: TIGR03936 family radical SAM-associated protein [Acidimicrobiales bacterium]